MSDKITDTPIVQTTFVNVKNKEVLTPIIQMLFNTAKNKITNSPIIQTIYTNRHDKETITPIVMLCFIYTTVDVNQQYVLFDKVKVNVYPKSS